MRIDKVWVIYKKELLDMVRDRRTIISAIFIPMLVFPLLVFGFGAAMAVSVKKVQNEKFPIVILGETNAPGLVEKIKADPGIEVVTGVEDYALAISEKRIRAAVQIPPHFSDSSDGGTNTPEVVIFNYTGEVRSQFAVRNLQQILQAFSDVIVADRLREKDLSLKTLKPFKVVEKNVAPPEKVSGNVLGGLIPYMIIILSFGGAMAPAIDLTAGEKERGTIETILASPVSRVDLVLGKFLMVMTASTVTTLISIMSFGATMALPLFFAPGGQGLPFQFSLPALAAVLFLILPLEIMFSAGLMAIALFAKTYKEAQTYISPLLMVVIMPAMVALLPGMDLKPIFTIIPIVNVTLLSKELLTGSYHFFQVAAVFGSSCIYAAIALSLAVMMFKKESVLFRS
ncbi:MAG: ABC transporter permease [Verrucomicrobiales bacterium]